MNIDFISARNKISENKLLWMLGILTVCFLFLFIIQALSIPFWQDDYFFLVHAQQSRLNESSWLTPFFPEIKSPFWRPLSMESYWRVLETYFAGNVRTAHLINLLLHSVAALSVGWFALTFLDSLNNRDHNHHFFAGALVAFLYWIHAAHLIPVIWVSAANSSITVSLAALTFIFWLKAVTAETAYKESLAFIIVFLCFFLALLSKEISIVFPALWLLLSAFLWPQRKLSVKAWFFCVLCGVTIIGWLVLHDRFTDAPDPAYGIRLGSNIIRNTVSLFLFFFNTPREALRFLVNDFSIGISLWGFICFALQFTSFSLFFYAAWEKIKQKGAVILSLFFVVSCAPYFFLNWNCYAYYVAIALFLYAIIIALSVDKQKIMLIASSLAIMSSIISWTGNYFVGYPSLIGRAFWVEEQLSVIELACEARPKLCAEKIYIEIENEHKYLGIGLSGLIYRVGFSQHNITVLSSGNEPRELSPVLVIPAEGDVFFRYNSML